MAANNDHPNIPFLQASGYSAGRPDGPPLWIVIHDMEASETPNRALSTAQYFATGAGGRSVSSHYCVDGSLDGDGSAPLWQCVDLDDSAWTVGNRPGNMRGINWELTGFASQTRGQWLDAYGLRMFARMAPVIQSDANRFRIPLERRSVAELKAFRPGITSHNDLRLAFGNTTHTDPGPNFPWDVFGEIITEDDMALTTKQNARLLNSSEILGNLAWGRDVCDDLLQDNGEPAGPIPLTRFYDRVAKSVVAQLPAMPGVDLDALVAALVPILVPALVPEIVQAVNDDAARRMAE